MKFKHQARSPRNGIAVIFDLEGFSRFFNQPDVQVYVGTFLNHVFSSVATIIEGGAWVWRPRKKIKPLSLSVAQSKFMGDGALFVLMPPEGSDRIDDEDIMALTNRIWSLKKKFPLVLASCFDDVPVVDLPARIRFGLARGSVYELEDSKTDAKEYIGFPINLASRLQRYCPDLGFIASARLGLPKSMLDEFEYTKVVATKIRGFPKEVVIVDRVEFEQLPKNLRADLFDKIKPG